MKEAPGEVGVQGLGIWEQLPLGEPLAPFLPASRAGVSGFRFLGVG